MLELNPGLIVWTIVVFLALLIILKKFAWKPIIDSLTNREKGIQDAIENAARERREAEQLLVNYREQLAKANEETYKILNSARSDAEKLKSEITLQAQENSKQMIEKAKLEIERNKDEAIQSLKKEVVHLAISAASKILDETLDEEKHKKIVDNHISNVSKN